MFTYSVRNNDAGELKLTKIEKDTCIKYIYRHVIF